ncbi:MAG: type I restriction-modification system endonuclease [Kofleriaceae bacterium]|nr:type I restriction-modification system endonuclease [Kofleriaceae bacterium]MBP9167697.1 type I restriction-modification system endonuclease [Kofleriaceae bacterium]MBP9859271.1 type I restriction-modification system endonuclease [Kofleriaceae bacterium]
MPASPPTPRSANFAFLVVHDPLLDHLGALAERYFADDPSTALFKLRQFGEVLAQRLAATAGLYTTSAEKQHDLLLRLRDAGLLPPQISDLFHALRKVGNDATHDLRGDHREALHQLRMARQLGLWFHRVFKDKTFEPGPFVPPPDPKAESAALAAELKRLREELTAQRSKADAARADAEAAAAERLTAAERAQRDAEERAILTALLEQADRDHAALATQLAQLQAAAAAAPPPAQAAAVATLADHATAAAASLALTEADTRRLIDAQLRAAGWEVDSVELTYGKGARPQKGKHLAIAEWPTAHGPADYALFVGLMPVGVVEAKRQAKDVAATLEQSRRYSRGYTVAADQVSPGGPWGPFALPFLFATNGRPFLRQLKDQSGIWFFDARTPTVAARPLEGWYTPDGLAALLKQDHERAHAQLQVEPTAYLGLRDYQLAAIRAVEAAIERGQRACLVAMATGTGKTRTCIGLTYRLLKTRRFRRVLFLVDRSALGDQTANAYKDTRLESLQTFADIFGMKELADPKPDADTKLHIATIQGLVKRVLYPTDEADVPPIDQYDCVVVDECHRGYLLDRELGDAELTFRDQRDYLSTYRRVLDHFDAVKIGLTATPALHTTEIFGRPVFQYSYPEAVLDGVLIDHEPPLQIVTKLAAEGMRWQAGEEMAIYKPAVGAIDTVTLADEVNLEIDSYNRRVITENFNRVVCTELARHIDPSLPGKTVIFCATDAHADMVVRLLKDALAAQYGEVEDAAVLKITGAADQPRLLIRRFKNERLPSIAVTVDLLTTGLDVPAISNIVFLRRVRSRILYEQMMGRATRRCDEIGKEVFRIFDAVDLYAALEPVNTMKPVVADPTTTFAQLAGDLATAPTAAARQAVLDQLVAKLGRKRHRLTGAALEQFEAVAGLTPQALHATLRAATPADALAWLTAHPQVIALLDRSTGGDPGLIISEHPDQLLRVEHGYGSGQQPADYLDSFTSFVRANLNRIPALLVVTQRPRELTRAQLKELGLALDAAGYSEAALRTAWRDATNQDIAASIIGFIRQAALGDALIPYAERVDRAVKTILARQAWTDPQRKWLARIADQLKVAHVVDPAALDLGSFKSDGGWKRADKIFDGKLAAVLGDLHDALWQAAR